MIKQVVQIQIQIQQRQQHARRTQHPKQLVSRLCQRWNANGNNNNNTQYPTIRYYHHQQQHHQQNQQRRRQTLVNDSVREVSYVDSIPKKCWHNILLHAFRKQQNNYIHHSYPYNNSHTSTYSHQGRYYYYSSTSSSSFSSSSPSSNNTEQTNHDKQNTTIVKLSKVDSTTSNDNNNNNNNNNIDRSTIEQVSSSSSSHEQNQDKEQVIQQQQQQQQDTVYTNTYTNTNNWIDIYLPKSIQPYAKIARIDKPIGTMLLLWPCWWSTALVSPVGIIPDYYVMTLFTCGAITMRSAGCAINDLWDQDIDTAVTRTKTTRPLVTGEITQQQAIYFTLSCIVTSLLIVSAIPYPYECFLWCIPAMGLVILYPTTKRYFPYPQAVLGITFNWGCFIGYVTQYGSIISNTNFYTTIVPLYCGAVCWTIVYDTLYGHQDKDDDKQLGLQSTAINFGKSDTQQRTILYTLTAITAIQWSMIGIYDLHMIQSISPIIDLVQPAVLDTSTSIIPATTTTIDTTIATTTTTIAALPVAVAGTATTSLPTQPVFNSHYYYLFGITGATSHLIWQISTAQFNNPQNLAQRFKSNNTVGAIVLASILAGKLL